MTCNIAVAGKGGSGKTSTTSLIIRYLKKNDSGLILAVDADANANLADSLGLEVDITLGSLIASFNVEKINIPAGFTKEAYLEYKLNEAVVESSGLDLVTMGRGEGPECYCYPNSILRKFLDTMSDNYAYVVMDNEAGLEHLSRRTTQNVDELLLVSDHSVKGVRTLARIKELVSEVGLAVKRQSVIINFVADGLDPAVAAELEKLELTPTAIVPFDEEVRQCDLQQKPMFDLPDTSKAAATVNELMTRLLKGA
ncbi:AAA family ATPase [Chloroflexota bacterium]